jgi:ubiquinone/menaquinone biosynthesis C-methylase UbiE
MSFHDHFSAQAVSYAKYRPNYPARLFEYLATLCPEHKSAWDCATGNGQSAIGLNKYFQHVLATDASEKQIYSAEKQQGIIYAIATAEETDIPAGSVDLITVAQAAHWFDLLEFYLEADRVLKKGGILAIWAYPLLKVNPQINPVINYLYDDLVGEHWPPERSMIDEGYADIRIPFHHVENIPSFTITKHWDFEELLGYFSTWSATKRYKEALGYCPIEKVSDQLKKAWGSVTSKREVTWEIILKIGRK